MSVMAVVLGFRVAIALTPILYRWVAAGGSTYPGAISNGLQYSWHRLTDPEDDPSDIGAIMSAGYPEEGAAFSVTDFTGTFELRKLQWRISRAPAGRIEDVDVCTFHFLKVASGAPASYVDGTDLPAVETALSAFWTTEKTDYPSFMHSDQFRWYKDGPAFYALNGDSSAYVPIGDNPAIRVTEVDVAGTSGATAILPPQCAFSITEKTSSRKHWGRFYLPSGDANRLDATGLLGETERSGTLAAAVTFYNACRTASMLPVVWSVQKPVRPKAGGGTLPAQAATAYEIVSLQMDDIVDVVRRRRYQNGVNKTTTTLT